MKRSKLPQVHDMHPNVTPLIDVVMCLIIFYMLVAKIGMETGLKEIELPESLVGVKLKDAGSSLDLNVVASAAGDEPFVSTTDLSGRQIELKLLDGTTHPLTNFLKIQRGTNDNFQVNIRADRNLDYRFLEPVLIVCAEARVNKVNFVTREPQQ